MPKSPIKTSLEECISKIKTKSILLSTQKFISGCRHPKTRSFDLENTSRGKTKNAVPNDEAATLEDVDRFLFENFKSLYLNDSDNNEESKCEPVNESPRFIKPPPDLCRPDHSVRPTEDIRRASATSSDDVASRSLTIRSITPDRSFASIDVETSTSRADMIRVPLNLENSSVSKEMSHDFIALLTYSPSPYDDFKQSMQEMIDARLRHHGKVDWDFMEELLSSYMNLNDKRSYKYILSAFVDLVVAFRENSSKDQGEI